MDILPNFLCYETGPVEVVSSPTETMASYRWNVDPRNQLSPKDFTVLKGEKERVNNQVPRSTLEKGLHSTGVNTKRGTGVHAQAQTGTSPATCTYTIPHLSTVTYLR